MTNVKRVLITGGTGSLGQALLRRFLDAGIERVCSYARCEVRAAALVQTLNDPGPLRAFVGDVRDRERLERCLGGIDTVIHAAALKRVDSGSYHPDEILKTNVQGTQAVIEASLRTGVKRVLLISSDKACKPTNIYGASKLIAEYLAISANSYTVPRGMAVAAVRYGNVLGSRGSVVHLWRQMVADGKPIVVTHPDMTRFWIRMDQACDLVEDALQIMRGGELIVPVLPSMRLVDLAEAMAPGYPRELAGLRPGGEKLAEELLSAEEISRTVQIGKRLVVAPSHHAWTAEGWSGDPVPADLVYRSDVAPFGWLSVEDMREWLKTVPDAQP